MNAAPCVRRSQPGAATLACGLLAMASEAAAQGATPATDLSAPRLAAPFGEHMVLQRDRPLLLWGRGEPGRTLQAVIATSQGRTRVGADGRWRLVLPALPAGGPHVLRLHDGHRQQDYADVLVGDLWLCAGQSNMAWPLALSAGGPAEAAAADAPQIRHLRVPTRASVQPAQDLPAAAWQRATPGTVGDFSAVGWHFARHVQAHQGVPVGLINVAWNGSMLETWVRRGAALDDPALAPAVRAQPADDAAFAAARAAEVLARVQRFQGSAPTPQARSDGPADDAGLHDPAFDHSLWPTLNAPETWEPQGLQGLDGVVWYRRELALSAAQAAGPAVLHLAKVDDWDETWVNGEPVGSTRRYDLPRRYPLRPGLLRAGRNVIAVRVTDLGQGGGLYGSADSLRLDTAAGPVSLAGPWRAQVLRIGLPPGPEANDGPSLAHNAMLAPLAGLSLRGVLWYQGESNVTRAERYGATFGRLIDDWRQHFGQPALPFLFVQLAPFGAPRPDPSQPSGWAALREAQASVLSRPGTGMAVTLDLGDADGDLHPKDKRNVGLRLAALALALDDPQRPRASGPALARLQRLGTALVAEFDTQGLGLSLRSAPSAPAELLGFELAAADGPFRSAQARIDGNRVIVSHPLVAEPMALRYAWADNPVQANLVDGSGLPAAPFRARLQQPPTQPRP